MGRPTVGLESFGPYFFTKGNGNVLAISKDLSNGQRVLLLLLVIVVVVFSRDIFTLAPLLGGLLVLLPSSLRLLLGDVSATVSEPGEEAQSSGTSAVLVAVFLALIVWGSLGLDLGCEFNQLLELGQIHALVLADLVFLLLLDEGLFGLGQVTRRIEQAVGGIHVGLPADADRLRHQPFPDTALAGRSDLELPAPVEVLDKLLVGEPDVVIAGVELEGEAQGPGLALPGGLVDADALDVEVLEAGGEDLGVGGEDELVDLGGQVGEDARPEVEVLELGGDQLVAFGVHGAHEVDANAHFSRQPSVSTDIRVDKTVQ